MLAFVEEHGGQRQTHLADQFGIGRAAAGFIIDNLCARNLVSREPDPTDRRGWLPPPPPPPPGGNRQTPENNPPVCGGGPFPNNPAGPRAAGGAPSWFARQTPKKHVP